jgi:hypothetical protein
MRNSVKVIFKNPKYNYTTSVSDQTTESDARKYFVKSQFDLGVYPNEDLQVCIDIEFNTNKK